jgi:putative DNA primase/helicase
MNDFVNRSPNYLHSREIVDLCLQWIDPNLPREEWVRVGFSIHSELGSNEGFIVFDQWSQKASNYDSKSAKSTWKSISKSSTSSGFTLGTLIYYAKSYGLRIEDLKKISRGVQEEPVHIRQYQMQKEAEQKAQKRQAEINAKKASELALYRWNNASPIDAKTSHPYLTKKKITNSFVARIYKGWLQIPAFNKNGVLTTLQSISPECKKIIIKDSVISGSSLSLGGNPKNKILPVLLCEGWATGETIQAATRLDYSEIGGLQVVISFNSGNLSHIADNIREKYPNRPIIICADNDAQNKINVGLEKAWAIQNKLDNIAVVYPEFTDADIERNLMLSDSYPTDFNDLYILNGIEVVMRSISQALLKVNEYKQELDSSFEI